MRIAARADANQAEIVAALRRIGCSIQHLHAVGRGCPDLLVGYRQKNFLLEIKTPTGKLTEDQEDWHGRWSGQVSVVCSVQEAIETVNRRFKTHFHSNSEGPKDV